MKVVNSQRRRRAHRLGWLACAMLATTLGATTAQAAPDGGIFAFGNESTAPLAADSARDHVRVLTPTRGARTDQADAEGSGALPVGAAAAFALVAPLLLRRRRT